MARNDTLEMDVHGTITQVVRSHTDEAEEEAGFIADEIIAALELPAKVHTLVHKADTQLEAIAGGEEGALELRLMAIELSKLGITRDELEDMARTYYAAKSRCVTYEDIIALGHITMRRVTDKEPQ
jgi:hypothetical protein